MQKVNWAGIKVWIKAEISTWLAPTPAAEPEMNRMTEGKPMAKTAEA